MSDFMYIGANGIYSLNAQQAVSATNSTSTTLTYGGLGASILGSTVYGGYNLANQYQQQQSVTSTLSDMLEKAAKPVKEVKRRAKGVLANLRSEIDGWHGDILERCPA